MTGTVCSEHVWWAGSQALNWVEEVPVHELQVVVLHGEVGEELPAELQWQERALCAQTDPEAFFPEKGGSTREAKRVCMTCEVRVDCLDYALANDERFGIWGGLSERERRRMKRRAV
jgi:WhiB family redox-sensing transcriptional regulator